MHIHVHTILSHHELAVLGLWQQDSPHLLESPGSSCCFPTMVGPGLPMGWGWLRAGLPKRGEGLAGGAGGRCRLAGMRQESVLPGGGPRWWPRGTVPHRKVDTALPPRQKPQSSCVRDSDARGFRLKIFTSKSKKSVKFKPFAIPLA